MDSRAINFIVKSCAGDLACGDGSVLIERVCTDSREARPGDLFVALRGDRFDGHDFLEQVADRGAAAVMVEHTKKPRDWPGCPMIVVADTRKALGQVAAAYRRELNLPIVAVGGSNGKTTTKELLGSILGRKHKTVRSPASFNNDIGVPLTLLDIRSSHEVAVLEVGTNHPGELAPLVEMIQPRYGVIPSIGPEHLEFFGDIAGVAREEGFLGELLPRDGKLFVNGDTPEIDGIIRRTIAPTIRVGSGEQNDWRSSILSTGETGTLFAVRAPDGRYSGEYHVPLLGRHQVVNGLLGIAVGAEFGLSPEEIREGLAQCRPPKMRLQLVNLKDIRVLNDAYNANEDSMRAALQTLREFPATGRRLAILGDMGELGRHGEKAHAAVGTLAAQAGLGHLFAVGHMASVMGQAAREAGLAEVTEFPDVEAAARAVRLFVRSGDVVLIKASRATRLERISDALSEANK